MSARNDPAIRTLALFFEQRRKAFSLLALVVAAAALEITVPFVTQGLVDSLVGYFREPSRKVDAMSTVLFSAGGILLATAATKALRSYYNYELFKTTTRTEDEIKCRALENYLRLHALYHHQSNSGQLIGRIDRGGTAVYTILYDIFGQTLIPPAIIFTGVLIALAFKNIWIAIAVLLPVPLYLLAIRRLTARIYEVEQKVSEDFEEVAKESYDIASNVMTVKKFSREEDEVERQRRLLRRARSTQYGAERLWALIENAQTFFSAAGRVTVIGLGGLLVLRGSSTIGEFVLFVALQEMAYQPISQISIIFPRLRRNMSRAERLFAVIDEPPRIVDKPGAPDLPKLSRCIEFRDVWFRYGDSDQWTLKNVNLVVPAGSTVALVGRSGSGKTTFINLLLRTFDPQRGAILIDGVDIRDVTQQSLRRQIAVVPQEVDLFSRSIAQNIAYGKPGASREEIENAAKVARAHDFIMRTSDGYDTIVGERGVRLSGGERQRIGIARALLRDPEILVFDEATSHLDTESEQLIQQATEAVIRGRTSFLIAHRLSTVLHADMIVVFNNGEIEATGTHSELLRTSETYQTLYELHLAGTGTREDLLYARVTAAKQGAGNEAA
ncbi:MAG: ABC transporter ATP-binding protein [Bryobacteraceae bacterium]|nr:ABC transporter ATP-binding protein [Bryobacteraceae bacterium]